MPSAAQAECLPRREGLVQIVSAAQPAPLYLPLKGGGRRAPTWSEGAGWGSTHSRDHHQVRAPSAEPPPDRRVQLHMQLRSTSALSSTSTVRRARSRWRRARACSIVCASNCCSRAPTPAASTAYVEPAPC